MRDFLDDILRNQPLDPTESARRSVRPQLRKRFYRRAAAAAGEGGFALLLDGKPVKTPARRALTAPTAALGAALAAEWNAQEQVIDPARMPLTRLANAVIDSVAAAPEAVVAEVAKYLGSDLLYYRAETPAGLVERQALAWDPVLAWAKDALGARFMLAQGLVHVAQPPEALAAAGAAIPRDPWRLGAVASIAGATGSALLALALAQAAVEPKAAWAAAHVDEDWQMQKWGADADALARRAFHEAEFQAAALVLRELAAAR